MLIILEGPDNAGKSTLAKQLSSDLGLEVVHPGGPPKNIAEVITRCAEQAIAMAAGEHVSFIYDRVTCISDMIYRGKPQYHALFREIQRCLFDDDLISGNQLIIYCRPSDARIKNFCDHVLQDHEDQSVVDHAIRNIDRIVVEYDQVMADLVSKGVNIYSYNFEHGVSAYFNLLTHIRGLMK